MLKLHARLSQRWNAEPFIVRLATNPSAQTFDATREALLLHPEPGQQNLRLQLQSDQANDAPRFVSLPDSLSYLAAGDIVRFSPQHGDLWVMYRRGSAFNSMLLTEQCNSNCVMCSQPPKEVDDSHLVDAYFEAIPLMSPETLELGITGGEPTLLGPKLLELISVCRDSLPQTALHMLSNGRMFNYLSLCQELARIQHPDLMIGIPIYADIASQHDFVVQAAGAFDQTIRGIMNLQRTGTKMELRVVLHRSTVDRLPQLARFITRNLPFVDHVALMGLEMMGYVRMNLNALWVDPTHYGAQLTSTVRTLSRHGMNVSIYNHQLCVLNPDLWPFARKSISDWKNEYLDVCTDCAARSECGGFFSSATVKHSDHIRPLSSAEVSCDLPV